jgi:uncharacterized protein YfdQ (DUF2303 family)
MAIEQPAAKTNIIDSALVAGTALARPLINPHAEGDSAVLVPPGHSVQYLTRPPLPFRKHGTVKLCDAESFIGYWSQQSGENSRIYGSLEPAQFVAVLNDYDDKQNWKDYRALYVLKHSREWLTWLKANKTDFNGNEAFAMWLEDNAVDIIDPDPANMMGIALNMRVSQSQGFAKAVRLQDGNVQFTYSNVVEGSASNAAGAITIPEIFKISIPVFEGLKAPHYVLEARFRYRLHSGALTIRYELVRPHKVIEEAFADLVYQIQDETKAIVLFGTPE